MVRKGTRLFSILHHKCPKCHEGNLFSSGPYHKDFAIMPESCHACGLRYQPEPSFYSGAMYVSHALQVAMLTTVYVALKVLWDPEVEFYIATTITLAVVMLPVTLRLSRSIYINFFYSYSPIIKQESDQPSKLRSDYPYG